MQSNIPVRCYNQLSTKIWLYYLWMSFFFSNFQFTKREKKCHYKLLPLKISISLIKQRVEMSNSNFNNLSQYIYIIRT